LVPRLCNYAPLKMQHMKGCCCLCFVDVCVGLARTLYIHRVYTVYIHMVLANPMCVSCTDTHVCIYVCVCMHTYMHTCVSVHVYVCRRQLNNRQGANLSAHASLRHVSCTYALCVYVHQHIIYGGFLPGTLPLQFTIRACV